MLLAAARMRMGGRRLRALANGDAAALREFLSTDSAVGLTQARRDAGADAAMLERLRGRIVALGDPDFPSGLRDLRLPPAFLCVCGVLPERGVAVVGAREARPAALAFAFDLARSLGQPIVSGLARGIDAAAHRGALAAGVRQVAYVGTGLAHTYPPEHALLADEIVARGGAIASERLPDEPVTRWALTQRDRLQAAHAAAVVLVESDSRGGAMHALRFARELRRPRFVFDLDASGNRSAVAGGATLLAPDLPDAVAMITRALRLEMM